MITNNLDLSQAIQLNFKDNLPFCAYKKPNEAKVMLHTQKDNSLNLIADFKESGFVFIPFNDVSEGLIFPNEKSSINHYPIPKTAIKNSDSSLLKTDTKQENTHIALVEKAVDFLKKGAAKKIVLSRKQCFNKADFNAIKTFFNLLNSYKSAMVYLWFHPNIGLWIGATPELFLSLKNNRLKTMALAGTQKKSDHMVWKKKEQEEQQYVTDFITDILDKENITYNKSETQTVITGNIAHIKTEISGILQPKFDLKKLVDLLHPTPAVCGIPKNRAKKYILEHENYPREFYTGFLGELNFTSFKNRNKRNIENQAYKNSIKESNLYVNLRCMQIKNSKICLYIGGGITKDSMPQKEYLETTEKAKNLLHFIQ